MPSRSRAADHRVALAEHADQGRDRLAVAGNRLRLPIEAVVGEREVVQRRADRRVVVSVGAAEDRERPLEPWHGFLIAPRCTEHAADVVDHDADIGVIATDGLLLDLERAAMPCERLVGPLLCVRDDAEARVVRDAIGMVLVERSRRDRVGLAILGLGFVEPLQEEQRVATDESVARERGMIGPPRARVLLDRRVGRRERSVVLPGVDQRRREVRVQRRDIAGLGTMCARVELQAPGEAFERRIHSPVGVIDRGERDDALAVTRWVGVSGAREDRLRVAYPVAPFVRACESAADELRDVGRGSDRGRVATDADGEPVALDVRILGPQELACAFLDFRETYECVGEHCVVARLARVGDDRLRLGLHFAIALDGVHHDDVREPLA